MDNAQTWRTILHNRCRNRVRPTYTQKAYQGPDHNPVYTFEVQIKGTTWGEGSGRSMAAAMDEAARIALEYGEKTGAFEKL